MANARRGVMVLGLVAAIFVAWLAWAWSPGELTQAPSANDAGDDTPPPPVAAPPPVAKPSPAAPALSPAAPPPSAVLPAPAEAEQPVQEPERIPTPHAMSLDQTKPPEASGPLAELKNRYASESRAADSSATEAKLRQLLSEARNVPSELVQGISCRRSVCKLEMQWTARRRIGFAVVLGSFKEMYSQRVAVEALAGRSEDGTYLTTLYLQLTP